MKKLFLFLGLLASLFCVSSYAACLSDRYNNGRNACAQACRYGTTAAEKIECLRQIGSHSFQASSCEACRYGTNAEEKTACIAAIADKKYACDEVKACRYGTTTAQKIECFSVSGYFQ